MKKTVFARLALLLFTILLTQSPEASNSRGNLLKKEEKVKDWPVFTSVRATALEL